MPEGPACSLSRRIPQNLDKSNHLLGWIPLEGRQRICSFVALVEQVLKACPRVLKVSEYLSIDETARQ